MDEVPDFGAVFTFGKSKFGDNNANKFWVKNDPIVAVACGDEHTAVVTQTGRAYTFGSNQWGQLALGHTEQTNKPSFVKSLKGTPLSHVACGRAHTLFAAKNGTVFACGGNGEHQVSENDQDEVSKPMPIPALQGIPVARLSCGVEHSMMLSTTGNVYLWGSGSEGQLGMGPDVVELPKPVMLEFTSESIIDASCGYYHTALVTQSGKVFTFGESEGGKLGLGDEVEDQYFSPQPVFLIETALRVCCGSSCTAVITTIGSLYMCGDGDRGQLGISASVKSAMRLTKVPCPQVVDISVGEGHSAVVTQSGHIYTFGDGRHGKLAHSEDNFSNLFTPYLVESFSLVATVTGVACGGCHSMVIAKPGRKEPEKDLLSSSRSKRHTPVKLNYLDQGGLPPLAKDGASPMVQQETIISLNKENIVDTNKLDKDPLKDVRKKRKEKRGEENGKIEDIVEAEEEEPPAPKKKDFKKEEEPNVGIKEVKRPVVKEVQVVKEVKPKENDALVDAESESVTDEAGESEAECQITSPTESSSGSSTITTIHCAPDSEVTDSEEETEPTEPTKTLVQAEGQITVKGSDKPSAVTSNSKGSVPANTAVEEESEYETETDEEGEDTEEEDEETEEKTEPETLVSKIKEEVEEEVKPKEEIKEEKTSKFKFWKKKPKKVEEKEPVKDVIPANQHNSKTCIIL